MLKKIPSNFRKLDTLDVEQHLFGDTKLHALF